MLKIIVGEKGTGKTKTLIDAVHAALDSQKGSIVFINKGTRHTYDLSSKIRLINTEEYAVENASEELIIPKNITKIASMAKAGNRKAKKIGDQQVVTYFANEDEIT